ncbi:MAG: T9SS type A sorting domain-containing protein [Armatimonadetes bacterium]|nr:T9SS type A sorting domain-containing protein [Armatimonadota bacterium]
MKKIVFILFISFLISQICFGNCNNPEQQDKLGVSIIGSRIQRGRPYELISATMVTPNNLPISCTDATIFGTVPLTLTLSSLQEVYLYGEGWSSSWSACYIGVTSPHSFSATFNTSINTIPTGEATLYAAGPDYAYEIVADFMVSNSVPSVEVSPASANRGTTVTTYVYVEGMDPTSTLVSDTTPFGFITNTSKLTPTGWATLSPGAVYQVTTTLPETMVIGDWIFYMLFHQGQFNYPYNTSTTFEVTDPLATWTGNVSSDWNNANNWDPASVPNSGSNVVIPTNVSSGNWPSLSGSAQCSNFDNSGTYTQVTGTLNLGGDFSNLYGGTSYLSGGIISATGDFDNDGSVTLADFQTFANNFTNNGTLSADNGGTFTLEGDFENDGTVDLADFQVFANNFTNNGTLSQTGGIVAVNGTVSNSGTYAADGGTFLYGSTAISQTIASSIDYNNLKATGENKVLSGNTSVYGSTYLDGAGIDIGNYDYTSYSHQFTQTIPTQDYIITSGTGALQYSSVSTPTVFSATFPVGPDANNYNPFHFDNSGVGLDWISAQVQPGITPAHSNSSYCLPYTWDIKYGPLGSLSANFEFGWNVTQETPLFTTAREAGRIQAHVNHTASYWEIVGSPGSAVGPGPGNRYTFEFGPLALVSGFALGDGDHTLPIELSSFTAQFISNLPVLCWTTQSESGNAGWNVYRGDYRDAFINGDAIQINQELIEGAGTTSIPTNYTFEDQYDVIQGSEYWYILESIDYSGETYLYGSVSLIIPEEGTTPELPQITILKGNYPNPFNPSTTIYFSVKENETAQLSIYNAKGQKIESISFESGIYNYLWDASSYATGTYLFKLESESISVTKKMILLK